MGGFGLIFGAGTLKLLKFSGAADTAPGGHGGRGQCGRLQVAARDNHFRPITCRL